MTLAITTIESARAERSTPQRLWAVMQLQATNPFRTLVLPWLILVSVFAMAYLIWTLVEATAGAAAIEDNYVMRGGIVSLFIFVAVTAIQAMNQTFRFALGHSVTRRDYYFGSSLYFALVAVVFGIGLSFFAAVEAATDGWGMGGSFFESGLFDGAAWWAASYVYSVFVLLSFSLGAFASTIYQRWKATGVTAFLIAAGFASIGAAALISWLGSWGALTDFIGDLSIIGFATWSLPVAILSGLFGYLVLRRVTPS